MKNMIKRTTALTIIFLLIFVGTAYASHNTKIPQRTPAFYGNVYVFYDDAPLLWAFMNGECDEFYEVKVQSVALVNKGEVERIRITIPYQHSFIKIFYEGHFYYFYLKPHLLGRNFIMFTFEGG